MRTVCTVHFMDFPLEIARLHLLSVQRSRGVFNLRVMPTPIFTKQVGVQSVLFSGAARLFSQIENENWASVMDMIRIILNPWTAVRVVHLDHACFFRVKIDADFAGDLPSRSQG